MSPRERRPSSESSSENRESFVDYEAIEEKHYERGMELIRQDLEEKEGSQRTRKPE